MTSSSSHTFRLVRAGSDLLTLLSADADFSTSAPFTAKWSDTTNPVTENGTYRVILQATGAGLNGYNYDVITTFSIETFGNKDYIKIESGASDNEIIHVRES